MNNKYLGTAKKSHARQRLRHEYSKFSPRGWRQGNNNANGRFMNNYEPRASSPQNQKKKKIKYNKIQKQKVPKTVSKFKTRVGGACVTFMSLCEDRNYEYYSIKFKLLLSQARQTGWDLLLLLLLYPYILTNILANFCRLFCWPSYLRFSSGANFAFNFG